MKKPKLTALQEQLLKSGLSNDAKLKQAQAEKRKQVKQQQHQGVTAVDEVKLSLEQMRQQQMERDRQLNRQKNLADEHKALTAQIKQLVELNRIAQDVNGVAYQFSDAGKVKTVHVSEKLREALIAGRVGIIRLQAGYEVVPLAVALKIQQRDQACVVVLNQATENDEFVAEDPYAAYQIPDDLIW